MSSLAICLCLSITAVVDDAPRQTVVVVVGNPGTNEYETEFGKWAERWRVAAGQAQAEYHQLGLGETAELSDRERLQQLLTAKESHGGDTLWLVLIGHGTFDGQQAKFNLRGPDVSAVELAQWLASMTRTVAVINCTSSSGPFINRISGKNRAIVTATKSGFEYNFARFGDFISQTVVDSSADLDKDDQVSLLEAFLAASNRVKEYYLQESRLATEHALLDDNGDSLGTPPSWFRGIRATKRAKDGATLDGLRAHQLHLIPSEREMRMPAEVRQRRDELELKIAALRDEKRRLTEPDYYRRLEVILLELARLYQSVEQEP